jgi:hypothetical protein
MKSLKYLLAIAALSAIAVTANAATITMSPFGDVPKNGTGIGGGKSNNPENNFFRLQTYLSDHPEFDICTPIFDGHVKPSDVSGPIDVTGFDYAVVHYGAGNGGTKGSGGGVAFFQIEGDGSVTFPQNGSGPNGKGGISSVDLFKCEGDHNVPDTGATAMLLGSALTGLGLVRRYLKR